MKDILNQQQLKTLQDIGLSKTQVQLYLTSLKHGMLSVLELSKVAKINRQQIYHDAEKLVELGLYDITKKRGRKYIPASPARLDTLAKEKSLEFEQKLSQIQAIIPILENISVKNNAKVTVKYYEGINKIKEAYQQELKESKNSEGLCFAGSLDHLYQFFPHSYWDKWNKQYVLGNNRSKMIVHYSAVAQEAVRDDHKYNRDTRYLHQFPLKVNIDIFNNIVLVISFEDEVAVWIESSVLASSYRILFNSLWGQAKPFRS
jgi:predicted transcriptional regulator